MSTTNSRDELVEAVLRAVRKESSQAAVFSQAVAERLGLAGSDVESLEVLQEFGKLTVGRLAELTGLTTGSATRMVDRMEQAGFVRRVADPSDRRRVLVELVPGVSDKLAAMHSPITDATVALVERYSDDQLRVLIEFLDGSGEIARQEALRMRAPGPESDSSGSYAAPVGGIVRGSLVFLSGVPTVAIRGDASLTELYRAAFSGSVPKMRVRDGVVTLAYARFGWFDWRAQIADQNIDLSAHWRRDRGEILLNAGIPWSIELRGGASQLTADLLDLRLTSLEMRGGASRIDLTLPHPRGVVPIHVAGGLSTLSVSRPEGVAVGLEVSGGAGDVALDGENLGARGGLSVQTPDADRSADRYEIKIGGGASRISVGTY